MADMFVTLGTWNWLIFGFILMALELLAPGIFLFWLGLAALLVGFLSFVINPSWQTQLIMFSVFAVAAVPLWRRFARKVDPQFESPYLNRRTEALVGRVFTLENPILDGVGRVRIDDTVWRVSGRMPLQAAASRSYAQTAPILRSSPLSSGRGPHVMRSGRHRALQTSALIGAGGGFAAATMGLQIHVIRVSTGQEISAAFVALRLINHFIRTRQQRRTTVSRAPKSESPGLRHGAFHSMTFSSRSASAVVGSETFLI